MKEFLICCMAVILFSCASVDVQKKAANTYGAGAAGDLKEGEAPSGPPAESQKRARIYHEPHEQGKSVVRRRPFVCG